MFNAFSNLTAAIAAAFTAPLLAALGTSGEMPPPPIGAPLQMQRDFQGQMPPPNSQEGQMPPNFQGGQPGMPPQGYQQGQGGPQMQGDGEQMMKQGGKFMFNQYDDHGGPQQNFMGGQYGGDNMGRQEFGGNQGEMMSGGGEQNEEAMRQREEMMMQQQEKMREQQEKVMKQQQLSGMKRMIQGAVSGIRELKKMISRAQKSKVTIPEEYLVLIPKVEAAIKTIQEAKEFNEDVESAMDVLQNDGEALRDIGPRLAMLTEWPRIITEANKQLVRLRKDFINNTKKAKKGKIDVTEIVAKIEEEISRMEKTRDALKIEATKADADFEDIMEVMQEEIFEAQYDIRNDINILGNMSRISSELKQVDKMLKNFDARAARLKKAGKNVARLNELLAEAKTKRKEVGEIVSRPSFDPETFFEASSDGYALIQDINDEFAELENRQTAVDKQFDFQNPFNYDTKSLGEPSAGGQGSQTTPAPVQ